MGAVYTHNYHYKNVVRSRAGRACEVPVSEMARALKRHKSTIFREIKRNFWADDAASQKSTQATSVMPHNCRQTSVDRYSGS